MLWDIIRDFIVQYITGGTIVDELGENTIYYGCFLGFDTNYGSFADTSNIVINTGFNFDDGLPFQILLGDWLATTITAVIMILLVVFAVWLVRWIFKAVSSAFLLK